MITARVMSVAAGAGDRRVVIDAHGVRLELTSSQVAAAILAARARGGSSLVMRDLASILGRAGAGGAPLTLQRQEAKALRLLLETIE
jgi:hypothetical protein